jgi:hypothetical protein
MYANIRLVKFAINIVKRFDWFMYKFFLKYEDDVELKYFKKGKVFHNGFRVAHRFSKK